MQLAVYRKNHQGFFDRQLKTFDKFPSKEECQKMNLIVAHPMGIDKVEMYKSGKYNPLQIVESYMNDVQEY